MSLSHANILVSLGIVYMAGFLTAFTPCVYPLIPVTLGIMGARDSGSIVRSIGLSLSFVLGLAVVYSGLGLLAASTGQLFGSLTQQPWVVWPFAAVFLAMGLSLLDLFELRLPVRWNTSLSRRGGRGLIGSFVLGSVSGILAVPCAGPILIGILTYVAANSKPLYGISLLLAYSLGLGTPFFVLAASSQFLHRLPRAGAWTQWIRHFCGLALIVAFFLFVKPHLSGGLFYALIGVALVLAAVFSRQIFPASDMGPRPIHVVLRFVFGIMAGGCLFLSYQPTTISPKSESPSQELVWFTALDTGLAEAQKQHKHVMVDFWASWCAACKKLDEQTFSDKAVKPALNAGFVLVKIDATTMNERIQSILASFKVSGLPQVLFLDDSGNAIPQLSIQDFIPPEHFLLHLENVRKHYSGG